MEGHSEEVSEDGECRALETRRAGEKEAAEALKEWKGTSRLDIAKEV